MGACDDEAFEFLGVEDPRTTTTTEAPYRFPEEDLLSREEQWAESTRGGTTYNNLYVWGKKGESCHETCMRQTDHGPMYCNRDGLFDINQSGMMEGAELYCSHNAGMTTRSITRTRNQQAPYMREDGKCFFAHFTGRHVCGNDGSNREDTIFRLCACTKYAEFAPDNHWLPQPGDAGNPFIPMTNPDPVTKEGWYIVSDVNCKNFCEKARQCDRANGAWVYPNPSKYGDSDQECWDTKPAFGLTCSTERLNSVKGVYDLKQLEAATTGQEGFMDGCDYYDDRVRRAKNPAYRGVDKRCYVNALRERQNPASCSLKSRSPDFRFCACYAA